MKRVVITGLGMVSPLGGNVETTWKNITEGESGAGPITRFDASDLSTRVAFEVKRGDGTDGTFNVDQWVDPKDQRRFDDFIQYALAAAKQAMKDSGLEIKTQDEAYRSGVLVGSGIGGLPSIYETSLLLKEKGPRRISPFFIPGSLINLASGLISINLGLKGPNSAVVTACSTGSHAIGDAARMIQFGDADVMVAGGTESPVNRISLAGFAALRALSTGFNEEPTRASRPYDKDRDGFVMGEGAGAVVLEDLEHARARGAKILSLIHI